MEKGHAGEFCGLGLSEIGGEMGDGAKYDPSEDDDDDDGVRVTGEGASMTTFESRSFSGNSTQCIVE
jgi:hypothetical protein